MSTASSPAQSLAPLREYEPMVVPGEVFADWTGTADIDQIGLFRWNSTTGSFEPIPFQIDKRRLVNLKYNISDPNSPAANANVCEYGYFPELGAGLGNFASDDLQATDEIVFMLIDAGSIPAPVNEWLNGTDEDRFEITLTDSRTGAKRWVYAFHWSAGSPTKSATSYMSWTADTGPCTNGPNSCGVAAGISQSALPLVHRVHFQKNWVMDRYEVNATGSFLPDMVNRFVYQQGPENEETWSTLNDPRFLGVFGGAPDRPVRVVRGVQGAQSGRHTTKYEFVYPTEFVSRVNLRVHPLPDLTAGVKQDPTMPAEIPQPVLWTETNFGKTPPTTRDTIDGAAPDVEQVDFDSGYEDWSEVATSGRGSYVHYKLEADNHAIPAQGTHYLYRDWSQSGSDDVGRFRRQWTTIGITQDGSFPDDYPLCPGCAINDGGCTSDPERPDLNFARVDQVMFPMNSRGNPADPVSVQGTEFRANMQASVTFSAYKQNKWVPLPVPTPCVPQLTAANSGNGAVNLNVGTTGCDPGLSGYRLYRSIDNGPFYLLREFRTPLATKDRNVRVGRTYSYAVSSYNAVNDESAPSAPAQVTVTDTTPPAIPTGLATVAGDGRLTLTWLGGTDRDLLGYDVWMQGPGGGWIEMLGSHLPAYAPTQWVQLGLTNGTTYCFKVEAVDHNGNSSLSDESCGVPGP